MDAILNKSAEIIQFIDQLRQRGVEAIWMGDLHVQFPAGTVPAPTVFEAKPTVIVPPPEMTPEELDALLYSETTKL